MSFMSVTLDVSKLSGWLNAAAYCRVERRGVRCGARCGPGGGRAWACGSARAACTARGPGCEGWGGRACAERTWNMLSMSVTLDVSKLSGWLKADAYCRVQRRGVRCGARCGPGGRWVWAGGSARAACTGRGAGCEGWGGQGHARSARGTSAAWL
eukprot:scaffold15977_cov53-Phaeocystis_antarctica.AAC.3